jgi:Xaa-Pro aminopeptidase
MAKRQSTPRSDYTVDLDWSKSGVKVEYQPRRTFGIEAVDYQERVNYDRLRKERLQRLQDQMQKFGFAALFLNGFGDNIRYATGTWDMGWRGGGPMRYCIVPAKGDPVLFETAGDMETYKMHCPWLKGKIRPAVIYRFVPAGPMMYYLKLHIKQIKDCLIELGINLKGDKIGVDGIDPFVLESFKEAGVNLVPGYEPIAQARVIKTKDELEILKQGCAIMDTAFWHLKYEWVKPGVTEKQILGKIMGYLWDHNFQSAGFAVVASGGNTNPYHRGYTDRIVRPGDMIIFDLAGLYFNGYVVDYIRCWPVDAKFTPEQKAAYKKCYNTLMSALKAMKPGGSSADVCKEFPKCLDDEGTWTGLESIHSMGLATHEGLMATRGHSFEYPDVFEQNMYFAVETFETYPGLDWSVRLEENGVITDKGFVPFTLFPFEEEVLEGTPVGELIP